MPSACAVPTMCQWKKNTLHRLWNWVGFCPLPFVFIAPDKVPPPNLVTVNALVIAVEPTPANFIAALLKFFELIKLLQCRRSVHGCLLLLLLLRGPCRNKSMTADGNASLLLLVCLPFKNWSVVPNLDQLRLSG